MNQERREFITTALTTVVAGRFGLIQSRSDFGSLKQIDAGVLNVGYAEAGPANGRVVLLLFVGLSINLRSIVAIFVPIPGQGASGTRNRARGCEHGRVSGRPAVPIEHVARLACASSARLEIASDRPEQRDSRHRDCWSGSGDEKSGWPLVVGADHSDLSAVVHVQRVESHDPGDGHELLNHR